MCYGFVLGYFFVSKLIVRSEGLYVIFWCFIEIVMMLNFVLYFVIYFVWYREKWVVVWKVVNDVYNVIKNCRCY